MQWSIYTVPTVEQKSVQTYSVYHSHFGIKFIMKYNLYSWVDNIYTLYTTLHSKSYMYCA